MEKLKGFFSNPKEFALSVKSSLISIAQQHKTNILLTTLLLVLIVVDQAAKNFMIRWFPHSASDTGPGLSLSGVFNEGLILNLQIKGVDILLGAIIFTLLLVTLLFFYVAGLRWLSQSFHIIKIGITVLFGGVFSNLFDKIRHGQVLDFIKFQPTQDSGSLFFNTADLFQTIGWIILIYGVIKLRKQIWWAVERRRDFLIRDLQIKKYQVEFVSYILWIMGCVGLSIFLIFHKLSEFSENIPPLAQAHLVSKFISYYFVMYVIFTVLVIGLTIYFSNKIYGPIYAVEKYLKALLKGEAPPDLKLRKGDQFKEMEELMSRLKDRTADKSSNPSDPSF